MNRRLVLLAVSALSCGAVLGQSPTWRDDAACVIYTHCTPCHHHGGMGHFSLVGYDNSFCWRNEIRATTRSGFMPPGPVNELDISSVARGTYLLQVRERAGSGVQHIKVVLE